MEWYWDIHLFMYVCIYVILYYTTLFPTTLFIAQYRLPNWSNYRSAIFDISPKCIKVCDPRCCTSLCAWSVQFELRQSLKGGVCCRELTISTCYPWREGPCDSTAANSWPPLAELGRIPTVQPEPHGGNFESEVFVFIIFIIYNHNLEKWRDNFFYSHAAVADYRIPSRSFYRIEV